MRFLIPAIAIVGVAIFAGSANAILIDNFDVGVQSVTSSGAPATDTAFGLGANTIGSQRQIDLPAGTPITGADLTVRTDTAPNLDRLSFSLDSGVSGSAILTWDGGGSLGSADFTDGGSSSFFSFDIIAIDQGNVDLIVTPTDGDSSDSFTLSNAGVGTVQFNFASFTGIDFTDIESLTLEIQGEDASDLTLDQFFTSGEITDGTAPEPSSIVMAICGLLGLAMTRRRRRRA